MLGRPSVPAVAALACAVLLTACGTSQLIHVRATRTEPADEQVVLGQLLTLLPEQHRDNVIYIDQQGRIYSNRPELKACLLYTSDAADE